MIVRRLVWSVMLVGSGLWSLTAAAQAPSAAVTAARAPIVVLPFTVEAAAGAAGLGGAPFWVGEAAAIALTDEFAALGINAASRADRVSAFEELQLPVTGALTRATMIRAGEMMGASGIVVGEVKLNGRMAVTAHLIDLVTGHQEANASADGESSAFFDVFGAVAQQLAKHLQPSVALVPPPHPPVPAFEDYVKGLVAVSPEAQARFLESAIARAPQDARTLLALWQLRTAQGDHAKALEAAAAVPAASADARSARYFAAESLIALKRYDEAFAALDALYKEAPAAALSNALGIVQMRRNGTTQTGGAPEYFFNRGADEAKDDEDIEFNLGYAYALANDVPSAIYWLREAVRREPADGDAHRLLAVMLTAQAKPVEAQREFDLAKLLGAVETATAPERVVPKGLERLASDLTPPFGSRVAPLGVDAQNQAAEFYLERGRRLADELRDREAIDELRRAIYVSPYLDAPHVLLGRIYQRAGRLSDAEEELTLALWSRESADAFAELAAIQLQMGKRDDARTAANRALAIDPANVQAKDVLRQIGGMLQVAMLESP